MRREPDGRDRATGMEARAVSRDDCERGPVRRDLARNRVLLMQAADVLFTRLGAEVSLDDVAKAAGLGVATAYRHLESRQALLTKLVALRIDQLAAKLSESRGTGDATDALVSFISHACELQARDRGMRVALSSRRGIYELVGERGYLRAGLQDLVSCAQLSGAVRSDFLVSDVPVLISMIGSITDCHASSSGQPWRRYLDLVLAGVLVN
jgi:AcrR family transcriptional regulator